MNEGEKESSQPSSNRFRVSNSELIEVIDAYRNRILDQEITKVEGMGGIQNFQELLHVDFDSGLNGQDFNVRIEAFGHNKRKEAKRKTFCDLLVEAMKDKILIILSILGVISLFIGIFNTDHPEYEWLDGFAIIIAVVVVVMVTAINDYQKEKKFDELQKTAANRQNTNVFRSGKLLSMHPSELLVGDIIEISDGNIIPADGILIEADNVEVDESAMTGENDKLRKVGFEEAIKLKQDWHRNNPNLNENNPQLHHEIPSPVCISGTTLAEGRGKMLVLAIGENSAEGRIMDLSEQDQGKTPLEKKLDHVADFISKVGLICAAVGVVILFVRLFIELGIGTIDWDTQDRTGDMLDFVIIGITILVVAIPEGLPLAVTLSLAYSVKKMQKENNLVKRLHACETMGGADMICSDKTGTLTTNQMTVANFWMDKDLLTIDKEQPFSQYPEFFAKLKEGICVNSNARIQDGKEVGSKTEIAMLNMLISFGHDDYLEVRERSKKRPHKGFPFSSSRKRASIIISLDEEGTRARAYVIGASEIVLEYCKEYLDRNGSAKDISPEIRENLSSSIEKMAGNGLRTLCLAYKELPPNYPWDAVDEEHNPKIETESLVCIGIVGIKDPVRPGVTTSVENCKQAGIKVRMVTGDNKNTAISIARECGIAVGATGEVLEGKEFRNIAGGIICDNCKTHECGCAREAGKAEPGQKIRKDVVKNMEAFREMIGNLSVLARSQPEDKYLLVTGLMQMGHVVAVTGDGTNDAPALKKADIGFAMGIAGTELAREAADIILMDDNFSSIMVAVMWGRNIYDNIQRFITFQLTVNLVAVSAAIVGGVTVKQSPLNPVQMLWVNLIMDTFASLALATEPPTDEMLRRPPHSRDESIVTPIMWKHILGQAVLQCIVVFTMLFAGEWFLIENGDTDDERVLTNPENSDMVVSGRNYDFDGSEDYKEFYDEPDIGPSRHFTYIFNVFVLFQLFNEANARKIKDEIWILEGVTRNYMFIGIWFLILGMQIIMVHFGSYALSCHLNGLTFVQWLICIGFAATAIPWRLLLLLIPNKCFKEWGRQESESARIVEMARRKSSGGSAQRRLTPNPHH